MIIYQTLFKLFKKRNIVDYDEENAPKSLKSEVLAISKGFKKRWRGFWREKRVNSSEKELFSIHKDYFDKPVKPSFFDKPQKLKSKPEVQPARLAKS